MNSDNPTTSPMLLPLFIVFGPLLIAYEYVLLSGAGSSTAGRAFLAVWPLVVGSIILWMTLTWVRIYKRNMKHLITRMALTNVPDSGKS